MRCGVGWCGEMWCRVVVRCGVGWCGEMWLKMVW